MALRDRDRPPRLTYDDYRRFPEDGRRHEILDGEHCVTARPDIRHQIVQQRLNFAMSLVVEPARLGQILSAPVDVVLSDHDIARPDLLFISTQRLGILTERYVQGAPDLIVEILSEGSQRIDQGTKLEIYEHAGVREYWIVDTSQDSVAVYRAGRGGATVLSATSGSRLTTLLLPRLAARLTDLFA